MERLYTAAEAAEKLNVSIVMIWEWARTGQMKCYRIGKGRNIRISQEQIDEFLGKRTQEGLEPTVKDG